MSDDAELKNPFAVDRGVPMVATWPRRIGFAIGGAAAIVGLGQAYLSFSHAHRTLASLAPWLVTGALSFVVIVLVLLSSEESRLARELRTARAGTAVIRDTILRRRKTAPFFLRFFSTSLGTAAVLLADGDRSGALDVLAHGSPLMNGGRLGMLKELIEADAERALGTSASLERAISRLRAAPRIGNREADRYRTHVLVKAALQHADEDVAAQLIDELSAASDDEERLYAVWLRVWFDADDGPPISEGELRMAALLARSHGAEDLVKKLGERIANLEAARGS